MTKLKAGFVQQMIQRVIPYRRHSPNDDMEVVWNGTRHNGPVEVPKTKRENKYREPTGEPDNVNTHAYWRRRREILKILEG